MVDFLYQLRQAAKKYGNRPAYLLNNSSISIAEVETQSNQIAWFLRGKLSDGGCVIGLCAKASLQLGCVVIGILKATHIFLGLDPSYPRGRLKEMIRRSHCRLLITDRPNDFRRAAEVEVISVTDLLRAAELSMRRRAPKRTSSDRPAYVIFTSGSTGNPKPVLAPLSQVNNRFEWMWRRYPFHAHEVCCSRMPLSFVDSIWEIMGPICRGVSVALLPAKRFRIGAPLIEQLARHRVSRIWMLPAAINRLLEVSGNLASRLPHLRFWVTTGDAIHPGVIQKFFRTLPKARLYNLYGTSEVWDATWGEITLGDARQLFCHVGSPIDRVSAFIVGDSRRELIPGARGEIAIAGRGLAQGYIEKGKTKITNFRTSIVTSAGRVSGYMTGDLGVVDKNGRIVFLGRRTTWVKRGSCDVSLLAVEAALSLHPLLAEYAATSDRTGAITAYFSARRHKKPQLHALLTHLRRYLAPENMPARLVRIARFPMTASGKIDRHALSES